MRVCRVASHELFERLAFYLDFCLFTGMEKTIQDVLDEIAKYAKTHNIDADDVARLFAAGCDDCGYEEFEMPN